ncbi:Fanconi anemia group F protein [Triplophysa rosa]|uniref:Fanconi anemia group F protein n=1 Tax=Triplophysa rosa TaxID=992332 RepID=A0A9W7W917_TRIRA|nr:Fanconi anemia group F protein [Triplophysa rosa]KAI7790620.1 Fanconi anemia group F protein [Triplophysa rosa]
MDAVLGRLQQVVELLVVSQLDCVNEWDHQTMLRAFEWAQYCEQVHARSHSNPALRSALESRLHDTNQRLRETLPSYSPVMLSELAQCQHKLLVNLLRNPSSPSSIIHVFSLDRKTAEQGLDMDQIPVITGKSALKLLCCSSDWTSYSGLQNETEVRGKLLKEHLKSILTQYGNENSARILLDSILHDSAGKTENLYGVIAAALLASDDDTNNVSRDVILDWLQIHDGCLSKLCRSLPPRLCCALSRESVTFRRGYCDVLKRWANNLEYDVMHSAWVPTCSITSEETVTFNVLFDRFRALLYSGSPVKEETETKLAELKVESGDFDVKGISVWTDLILKLKV